MLIEFSSELYPEKLKEISKPPSRLYVEGNVEILKKAGIAVVGSRTNTQYGKEMCEMFTQKLVEYNINIISGLAVGIDAIAHKTCLKNYGKTIAVLPSGIKNIYPKENIPLYKEIIKNGGAIISEYEDEVKADSKKFLERNRIVAGLAIGTLVVEAGYRSGTTVTAGQTSEQGKPVFCIPSSLTNMKGISTNELIKKGANLVTNIEDILKCYPNIKFEKRKINQKNNLDIETRDIPQELVEIYKTISDTPQDVNEIARKLSIPVNEVIYKIMLLQLNEKIKELPGQRFIRKED